MSDLWTYEITHYDRSDSFLTNQSLSNDLISVPLFTDTGSGTFNSAVMMINIENGKYITSGLTIEDLDRIRIKATDQSGDIYDVVYDVMKRTIRKIDGDRRLELTLLGIEHWLDKFNYSRKGFFKNANEMAEKMAKQYLDSRGAHNPLLTTSVGGVSTNFLPKGTSNIYDYGIGPEKIYQRLLDLADKLGGSVENGGVLNYYDVKVLYDSSGVNLMALSLKSQGNTEDGKPTVTIQDSSSLVVSDIKGNLDSEKGNVVTLFGADTAGSIPTGWSKFKSARERREFTPQWSSNSVFYPVNARVQRNGQHYLCNTQHTSTSGNGPPGGNWSSNPASTDYLRVYQYSEWTDDKAESIWRNCNANPLGVFGTFKQAAMIDGNISVWDESTFRIGVDVRANNPDNIPIFNKYHKIQGGNYRGLRVLVDTTIGTASGDFSGTDINGKVFANSIAEFDKENNRWFVKYEKTNNFYAGVVSEADVYRYKSASNKWVNVTKEPGLFLSGKADCFHPYTAIGNTEGIITDQTTAGFPNKDSAVFVQYDYHASRANIDERNDAPYYKQGAWLTIRPPLPNTSYGGIGEDVGDIYGGGLRTPIGSIDDTREPACFDFQNNEWTPKGFFGWNEGTETENLGQCSSIDFFMKLKDETSLSGLVGSYTLKTLSANYKIRCVVIDLNDNVAYHDFVIPFNSEWAEFSLPKSGFINTRNRKPKEIIDLIIPPKQLNIDNEIEWRHIKQITFQTQESYDSEGRYDPQSGRYGIIDTAGFTYRRITMYLDAFRFRKPLVVNTGIVSSGIAYETEIEERPDIHNYFQALGDALAVQEKRKHKYVEYTIQTSAKFDIKFGDYFYFLDPEIVPFNDDSTTGKVLLVATHIEYSMTEEGLVRTIIGIRRFT